MPPKSFLKASLSYPSASRNCTAAIPSLLSSSTALYAAVPYSSCDDSLPIQKCICHASFRGFF